MMKNIHILQDIKYCFIVIFKLFSLAFANLIRNFILRESRLLNKFIEVHDFSIYNISKMNKIGHYITWFRNAICWKILNDYRISTHGRFNEKLHN